MWLSDTVHFESRPLPGAARPRRVSRFTWAPRPWAAAERRGRGRVVVCCARNRRTRQRESPRGILSTCESPPMNMESTRERRATSADQDRRGVRRLGSGEEELEPRSSRSPAAGPAERSRWRARPAGDVCECLGMEGRELVARRQNAHSHGLAGSSSSQHVPALQQRSAARVETGLVSRARATNSETNHQRTVARGADRGVHGRAGGETRDPRATLPPLERLAIPAGALPPRPRRCPGGIRAPARRDRRRPGPPRTAARIRQSPSGSSRRRGSASTSLKPAGSG